MIKNLAVKRYGKALYELAVEEDSLDLFNQELTDIAELMDQHPDLEKVINHPRIPEKKKNELVKKILGDGISPMVVHFITLLIDKDRQYFLKDIIMYFQHLVKEAKGIMEVEVTTAYELDSDEEEALKDKMKKLTGKEIELEIEVDPGQIGGMRLRIGDKVIDGTIKRHLERLKDDLSQIQVSQLGVS